MLVIYGLFHHCVDRYKSWKMLKYWENGVRYSHIKCFVAHGFKFYLAQIMVSFQECARVPKQDIDAKTQSPHAALKNAEMEKLKKCWDAELRNTEMQKLKKCWHAELLGCTIRPRSDGQVCKPRGGTQKVTSIRWECNLFHYWKFQI